MSALSRLKILHLLYLSKPASDRLACRTVWQHRPRKIVELGIGTAERSLRMLWLAGQYCPAREIRFTGIDPFEARSAEDGPGLDLKAAHRLLKATGAKIQLVPGTPYEGLSRVANQLGKVDLVVLSPRPDAEQLARAWFYVPRLLHDESRVLLETLSGDGQPTMRLMHRMEIEVMAGAVRRRAA